MLQKTSVCLTVQRVLRKKRGVEHILCYCILAHTHAILRGTFSSSSRNFMKNRVLVAEFIGTFALALGVSLAVARDFPLVPLVAAMTVGIFVYTVGSISGAHLNPSVTFGLWSIKKIKAAEAISYIVVQALAGFVALLVTWAFTGHSPSISMDLSWMAGLGELMGGFILVFGVCSVVFGRVKDSVSGLLIGSSLLIGILLAANLSLGVVNPAVDIALGILSPLYILGVIVGGIAGAQTYAWLMGK